MAKRATKEQRAKAKRQVLYLAEMPDLLPPDVKRKGRSSPLPWLKLRTPAMPIGERCPHAVPAAQRYVTQRQYIRALADGFALLGIYDELVIQFGGNRIAPLRGWLINHAYRPATIAEIGAVIGCTDRKLLARAMKEFQQIELIIRVELPDLASMVKNDLTIYPTEVKDRIPIDIGDDSDAEQPDDAGEEGETPLQTPDETPEEGEQPPQEPHLPKKPDDADDPDDTPVDNGGGEGEEEGKTAADDPDGGNDGCQVASNGDVPDAGRTPAGHGPDAGRTRAGRRPDAGRTPAGHGPDMGRTRSGPPLGDCLRSKTMRRETGDCETPTTASATPQPSSADGSGERCPDKETASASPQPDGGPGDGQTGEADTPGPETTDADDAAAAAPTGRDAGRRDPPATTPPTADAVEPTEADQGQGQEAEHQPEKADDAAFERVSGGIDSVEILVRDIGKALYPTRDDLVIEGRKASPPQDPDEFEARERGTLTAAWAAVMMLGLGAVELVRLQRRAVKEAERIRRKKTRKPKGAPWKYWFNRHMESMVGPDRWANARRGMSLDNASGPP